MEDDLKILKVEYLSNQCMDCDLQVLRGELEENSEEILSAALLRPACFTFLSASWNKIMLPVVSKSCIFPFAFDHKLGWVRFLPVIKSSSNSC